jgi:hypothetical protein
MRDIILALEKSRQVPIVAIFAASAYVQPDYLLANVPLSTWSVTALMILFAANGALLWFCIRRTFKQFLGPEDRAVFDDLLNEGVLCR